MWGKDRARDASVPHITCWSILIYSPYSPKTVGGSICQCSTEPYIALCWCLKLKRWFKYIITSLTWLQLYSATLCKHIVTESPWSTTITAYTVVTLRQSENPLFLSIKVINTHNVNNKWFECWSAVQECYYISVVILYSLYVVVVRWNCLLTQRHIWAHLYTLYIHNVNDHKKTWSSNNRCLTTCTHTHTHINNLELC